MNKYKILTIVVLFAAFIFNPTVVLCKNIEGWAGIKWGSSVKAVMTSKFLKEVKFEEIEMTDKNISGFSSGSEIPFIMSDWQFNIKLFFKNNKLYGVLLTTYPAYNFLSKADASKLYQVFKKAYGKHKAVDSRVGGEQYFWEDDFGKITITFERARGAYATYIEYAEKNNKKAGVSSP